MPSKVFHIGHIVVEPELDTIIDDGRATVIRPQVMDLLVYLAANSDRVVSNDEFLSEIWKGKVVTQSSIYSCLNELRRALGDDAHDPRFIQTIPKRGYKLIAPVRNAATPIGAFEVLPTRNSGIPSFPPMNWLLVLIVLVGTVVWISWYFSDSARRTSQENLQGVPFHSVAVLPFADLSEGQDKAYLAAGLSEEIIHRLAQIPDLRVTGRTSSFLLQSGKHDVAEVGRLLGVAHVLEGSVRTDGEQVRVTAQLLRVTDHSHVWSKVYDRPVIDLLSIQEDVSREIALSLALSLASGDGKASRARPAPLPTAHDLYLQALSLARENTRTATLEAERLLERALQLDSTYAEAMVLLARFKFEESNYLSNVSLRQSQLDAEKLITKALELDPDLAQAYIEQGWLAGSRGEVGEPYFRKALSLNPNLAAAWYALAVDQYNRPGRWDKGIEAARKAVELDPLWMEPAQFLVMYLDMSPPFQDEARIVADRLFAQFPDHSDILVMQSELRWSEGEIAQAIGLIEKARQADLVDSWVLANIKTYWLALGEFERAAEFPNTLYQWTEVLDPRVEGRSERLEQLAQHFDLDDDRRAGVLVLLPWTFMMTGDPEKVLELYAPLLEDERRALKFENSFWMGSSLRYSPALTLATSFHMLGDHERAGKYLAKVETAIKERAGPRVLLTHKLLQTMARVSALKGEDYYAMQLLEQWALTAPPDPRELLHPAYQHMRDSKKFKEIVQLQQTVINRERARLGLAQLDQLPWLQ